MSRATLARKPTSMVFSWPNISDWILLFPSSSRAMPKRIIECTIGELTPSSGGEGGGERGEGGREGEKEREKERERVQYQSMCCVIITNLPE